MSIEAKPFHSLKVAPLHPQLVIFSPAGVDPAGIWGFIPQFLNPADPRCAIEQIDAGYAHGGGWRPLKAFRVTPPAEDVKDVELPSMRIQHPGDPALKSRSHIRFRDERLFIFEYSWVAAKRPEGAWEVCRLD